MAENFAAGGRRAGKRILVVEDDFLIALGISTDLSGEGYDVSVRTDGNAGLSAAQDERFDLIITDYLMPKMNGLEMIDAIRNSGRTLPIVLTSSIPEHHIPDPLGSNYDAYLSKPYSLRDLRAVTSRLIDGTGSKTVSRPLETEAGMERPDTDAVVRRVAPKDLQLLL